jgi:uncharacterized membrane protein YeiH
MTLPSFPNLDLLAAGINALNGALVARNPSHDRGYTLMGLLIMAFFGGIGGGVSRDLLLNDIPGPLLNPMYLAVCLLMGLLGLAIYRYAETKEEHFRKRILAYFKSFSLPWFAILGAHKALEHNLGIFAAVVVGVLATTAGGVLIDLFSNVTPEVVMPKEHIVTTAVWAGLSYSLIALYGHGWIFERATLIAGFSAFLMRVFAVRQHWPQIVPYMPPVAGPTAESERPPLRKVGGSRR